jgi:hypothetical protein
MVPRVFYSIGAAPTIDYGPQALPGAAMVDT